MLLKSTNTLWLPEIKYFNMTFVSSLHSINGTYLVKYLYDISEINNLVQKMYYKITLPLKCLII